MRILPPLSSLRRMSRPLNSPASVKPASLLIAGISTFLLLTGSTLLLAQIGASAPQAASILSEIPVEVTVQPPSEPAIHVDRSFAGFSYEKGYICTDTFDAANIPQVQLFKRLGPGIFRIGANQVTFTHWDAEAKGGQFPTVAPSDIDRLAGFLRACNWRVIYAVNHACSTPQKAAEEAAYAAKAFGDRLLAFEIGNEPDLYRKKPDHPERPRPAEYSYEDFYREWTEFADAIGKAVPNAALVGPSTAGEGNKEKGWMPLFTRDAGKRIQMITQHYYIRGAQDPKSTIEDMLRTPEPQLVRMLGNLRKWTQSNGIQGGFHLNEANSYWGGGKAGLCDSHASALWVINFLFTCAQNEACRGVSLHGGSRAPYTPIAYKTSESEMEGRRGKASPADHKIVDEIRPEYYGISFFSMAVGGRLQRSNVIGANPENALSAYVITDDDGSTRVALVNTSATATFVTNLNLGSSAKEAALVRLTGPSPESTKGTLLGGALIGTDGSWNPKSEALHPAVDGRLSVAVAPFSAVLVKIR